MSGPEMRAVELAYDRDQGVADRVLFARLARTTNPEDFAALWLAMQARALEGARTGVLILGEADKGPFLPAATWPAGRRVGADLSIAAETALTERRGVLRDRPAGARSEPHQSIALPILLDGALHGVVAFELDPRGAEALAEAGRRLHWGSAWVEALVRRRVLLPNRQLIEAMDSLAALLEAPGLKVAMQALVSDLARVLGAEWAACGLASGAGRIEVGALSQAVTSARRPQVTAAVAAAMQEVFDQKAALELPEDPEAFPRVTRAHRSLADLAGPGGLGAADGRGAPEPIPSEPGTGKADDASPSGPGDARLAPTLAVMSFPILSTGEVLGVLSIVGRVGQSFSTADRDFCRLLATLAGPALDIKRRDDRWIGAKVAASGVGLLRRLFGPRQLPLKLGALALVAAAVWLSVATAPYRVTAPATVEGAVQRAVAVPIAGFVAMQQARAGDRVAKGDLLARLDDREFQLERTRLVSERDQRLRAYKQAFAQGERDQVQVLKAEIEQAQARLDLLEDQIARVDLRAPLDGIVVRGDLSQMIGAPVQRGDVLFEIAPLDDFRLILKVDERDANVVREGQEGDLVLAALSGERLHFRVTKWTPISTAESGHNSFRVEAALEEAPPALRPGMEGVAKIEIDRRKILDIATARLVQWFRLTLWRWQI